MQELIYSQEIPEVRTVGRAPVSPDSDVHLGVVDQEVGEELNQAQSSGDSQPVFRVVRSVPEQAEGGDGVSGRMGPSAEVKELVLVLPHPRKASLDEEIYDQMLDLEEEEEVQSGQNANGYPGLNPLHEEGIAHFQQNTKVHC